MCLLYFTPHAYLCQLCTTLKQQALPAMQYQHEQRRSTGLSEDLRAAKEQNVLVVGILSSCTGLISLSIGSACYIAKLR